MSEQPPVGGRAIRGDAERVETGEVETGDVPAVEVVEVVEVVDEEPKSWLDKAVALISSIFAPILWTLAGAGLFKAFLSLAVMLGWLATDTTGYVVLNAAADAFLHFLPLILAITAAERFGANRFTSVAIAGALIYPSIVALNDVAEPLNFFGIPLVMMSYVSSVLPIIVAVWVQSHFERVLLRVLPDAIKNFTTPLLSLLVMVPLILLTIGPLTTLAANGLAGGITWLFAVAPWAAGAVLGGSWHALVIVGLHWGLLPIIMMQLGSGFSILMGPALSAVIGQAGATFGVLLRTKDAETRKLAGPAVLSALLAGITEPSIYGVNLPRKKPFVFGLVGGAVGGSLGAIAGGGATSFVFPSLIGIPAFLATPNLPLFFIGVAAAFAIAFALTFFFGVSDAPSPSGRVEPGPDAATMQD